MDPGIAVDPFVLAAGGLIVLGVLAAAFADRIRVPTLVVFLGVGMLIGSDGLGWVRFDDPGLAQTIAVIALLVILFEGGLTTSVRNLRDAAGPGLALATVGVVLTATIVAAGVLLLTDLSLLTALLLGAVVASTDAAAVFAIVRRAPLPRRVSSLLEVESGANDPMAVLLTIALLEAWAGAVSPGELARFAVVQLLGGAAVGAAVGVATIGLLRSAGITAATLYPLLALGAAGLAYGGAAALGASGFLAVYLAGLLIGVAAPRQQRLIRTFHQALAGLSQIVLFLMLGVLVSPSTLPAVTVPALAITAVLLLVARPVAVHVCLGWHLLTGRWRLPEATLVSWAGLRGAVPIVLATFPLTVAYPQGAFIFSTVFFVVLISTALQGSTISLLAGRLGLRRHASPWAPVAECLAADSPDFDVIEVRLTPDLPVVGSRLREAPPPTGLLAVAVVRDGRTVLPDGATVLRPHDRILLTAAPHTSNERRAQEWVAGGRPRGGERTGGSPRARRESRRTKG